jgi:serine/threonine-protein kinase
MIGKRLNNFEIVRLVGEGGMGAVYEAEHPVIHRKVAVKVLRRELAVDAVLVRRFINEARATNEIRHPGIRNHRCGTFPDGVPYLIMEMLEGESLASRIERLVAPVDVALDFALQTASALSGAFARNRSPRSQARQPLFGQRPTPPVGARQNRFRHRQAEGRPHLEFVDTKLGSVIGTPAYMSPEQCRGIPHGIDQRTDIYSLASFSTKCSAASRLSSPRSRAI